MYIYISGPYRIKKSESKKELFRRINQADKIGKEIAKKGHIPIIPHTMMREWEGIGKNKVPRKDVIRISLDLLNICDAIYIIDYKNSIKISEGVRAELKKAKELNLKIYKNLDEISININSTENKKELANIYLKEYSECMQSYRHTYQTIWQAGSFFIAVTAALITYATYINNITLKFISFIPYIFWWLGIFTPMDRYGKIRFYRLVKLENIINSLIPKLNINHFRLLNKEYLFTNKHKLFFRKLHIPVGIWVDLFGLIIILVWIFMILNNILL